MHALEHVTRAVAELGQADGLLAACGVHEKDRGAIASCVLSLHGQESWLRGELQRAQLDAAADDHAGVDAPGMPPAPAVAVLRLFGAASVAELETEAGEVLPVRLERASGERVTATVMGWRPPSGSRLRGRIRGDGGAGWRIDLACEAVTELEGNRGLLSLRVTGVEPDGDSQRLAAGGEARLEVVSCERIAEESHVYGQVLELSTSGFAFSTTAPLREGDRLRFHRRYFAEEVDGDVRVASLQHAGQPGSMIVSCWFVDIDPRSQAAIGRVLAHATAKQAPVDYRDLLALGDRPDRERRSWLRGFRRRRATG
jgi:hypothetical protein